MSVSDSSISTSSANSTSSRRSFKWTADLDLQFCVICQALGWIAVTPKQISQLLPQVQKQIIASHLQKLRNDLIKDFGKVEDAAIPKHLKSNIFH